jgi:hypothetical protein
VSVALRPSHVSWSASGLYFAIQSNKSVEHCQSPTHAGFFWIAGSRVDGRVKVRRKPLWRKGIDRVDERFAVGDRMEILGGNQYL